MARFLIYTSPARGHVYPLVPMLQELGRRGHEVSLRGLSSQVPALREAGLDAAPIDPAIEALEHHDYQARSPFAANRRVLRVYAERAEHEVKDLERAIEETDPDVLVIDIATEGAAALAEVGDRPWVHYTPYCMPLPSSDVPPFGLGLAPRPGAMGRARDAVVRRLLFDPLMRTELPLLNGVREGVGAAPLQRFDELFLRAPLHLYLSAEPFEYPRSDWPASFRLVGPGIWEPPAERPEWLDELEGPIVMVTCSSEFQNDGRLVAATIRALEGDEVAVVASTAAVDPATVGRPQRGRVERFLPHGHILERAACVVCHGGMGVTQKALMAGVPVCVVPFGRDQLEVGGHVRHSGAGTSLLPQTLRPRNLRRAIHDAMDRAPRARELAAALAEVSGPRLGADALEEALTVPGTR